MRDRICHVFSGLLLLCLIAGCSDRQPPEPEAQNVRPAKIMTVMSSGTSERYEFTARIEASQTVDLSFEVGGPLETINVREGATIPQGSAVAALDPRDFELAVSEANVQLRLATQDLTRKRQVFEQNGIARSQVDDAQSNFELQQVRASQAQERLADTRIVAPFEAYVSRRYLDPGVNVKPGDPVVRLLDLQQLLVVMSVPQGLVATASAEQMLASWAEFSFIEGQQFPLTYHENRGEADALAQTYEVTFIMDNPAEWNILPGMTANAFVEIRQATEDHILVPASALVPTPGNGLSVWVYDEATGQVSRREVTTDAPLEAGVPVTSGLTHGEPIIVAGASQLQEGMQVRPLP